MFVCNKISVYNNIYKNQINMNANEINIIICYTVVMFKETVNVDTNFEIMCLQY